jgi:hypothetical protein
MTHYKVDKIGSSSEPFVFTRMEDNFSPIQADVLPPLPGYIQGKKLQLLGGKDALFNSIEELNKFTNESLMNNEHIRKILNCPECERENNAK